MAGEKGRILQKRQLTAAQEDHEWKEGNHEKVTPVTPSSPPGQSSLMTAVSVACTPSSCNAHIFMAPVLQAEQIRLLSYSGRWGRSWPVPS